MVENQFIDLNKNYFDAEVRALDFRKPEAIRIINSWVNSKTSGKIKDVINYIDESTMLFLINAIYFKSNWTYEFNKNLTKDDYFNLTDGSKLSCKMMNQSGDISYFETSEFQAADLPYSNRQFHMSIFLPKEYISIDSVIATWNPINWKIWVSQFRTTFGNLSLPKFKLEYRLSLVNTLKSMGMEIAFNPEQADFTNINPNDNLFIDEVLHKTYVNVDEEGTEAAAVTAISIGITSIGPSGFVMRVDRPFMFVIWESQSNTILFLGKIVSPSI